MMQESAAPGCDEAAEEGGCSSSCNSSMRENIAAEQHKESLDHDGHGHADEHMDQQESNLNNNDDDDDDDEDCEANDVTPLTGHAPSSSLPPLDPPYFDMKKKVCFVVTTAFATILLSFIGLHNARVHRVKDPIMTRLSVENDNHGNNHMMHTFYSPSQSAQQQNNNQNQNKNEKTRNPQIILEEVRKHDMVTATRMKRKMVEGMIQLIDVKVPDGALDRMRHGGDDSYENSGIRGLFCRVAWNAQKKDPSRVPMFKDMIHVSRNCKHPINADLYEIVQAAKLYDQAPSQNTTHHSNDSEIHMTPHTLKLGGFVHHETRCGSTLVANALVASHPDQHRVYSENPTMTRVMNQCMDLAYNRTIPQFPTAPSDDEEGHIRRTRTLAANNNPDSTNWGSCHLSRTVQIMQDILYLLGRSTSPLETTQFYKLNPHGTMDIALLRRAFPDTPWMYLFRDPVEIMMSHFNCQGGKRRATCMKLKRRPNGMYVDVLEKTLGLNGGGFEGVSFEEHCAAYLATITNAVQNEQESSHTGLFLNYEQLIQPSRNILLDSIFPLHFNISVTPNVTNRVNQIMTKYSKRRDKSKDYEDDRMKKEEAASKEVRQVAEVFLGGMHEWMGGEEEAGLAVLRKSRATTEDGG